MPALKGASVVGNVIVIGGHIGNVIGDPTARNVAGLGLAVGEAVLLASGPVGVACFCAIQVIKLANAAGAFDRTIPPPPMLTDAMLRSGIPPMKPMDTIFFVAPIGGLPLKHY
jgi:hypothetical protein